MARVTVPAEKLMDFLEKELESKNSLSLDRFAEFMIIESKTLDAGLSAEIPRVTLLYIAKVSYMEPLRDWFVLRQEDPEWPYQLTNSIITKRNLRLA